MTRPLCLVLEDDKYTSRYLAIMLDKIGYEVIECNNIGRADRVIENVKINLAVLDGLLPDGSGVLFADKLSCPVIFVTWVSDEVNRKEMWERGCVYQKPVDASFKQCVTWVVRVRA